MPWHGFVICPPFMPKVRRRRGGVTIGVVVHRGVHGFEHGGRKYIEVEGAGGRVVVRVTEVSQGGIVRKGVPMDVKLLWVGVVDGALP